MTTSLHRWQFFRAGGFDQVQLSTPADLAALAQLDQKLWAALACPTDTLEIDARMLAYIDLNKDGRIRAREVLSALDWTLARLANPQVLFEDGPLPLTALADDAAGRELNATAKRLLSVLGRADAEALCAADTDDLNVLFPAHERNGDGVVPASLTSDAALQQVIAQIITVMGAKTDRSGEAGVDSDTITGFFAQAAQAADWQHQADAAHLSPFGADTLAAVAALAALKDKIDDYFTRVEMAAFDPRATHIMNGEESELVRLASLSLANTEELKKLPLAGIHQGANLPLTLGINPAYRAEMAAFVATVVQPVLGDVTHISRADWQQLQAKAAPVLAWQAARPAVKFLNHFSSSDAQALMAGSSQAQLMQLVAEDLSVELAANGLVDLDKLLRFKASLVTLLRNFVSFYDFYSRQKKAIFQAGTLFIDGKSCDLVVEVKSVDAHAAIAAKSESYLVYCNCVRRGEPVRGKEAISVVAAITAGDEGNIVVGRNGIFYDRDGNDWDATVVKVVQNAISVSEAFWSPYRRVADMISAQIQKFAQSRDADMVNTATTKLNSTTTAPVPAAGAPAKPADKPFDIAKFAGIFAAIGLAIGALGTAMAAVFTGLMSLAWWQFPLVIIGVMVAVSGPSMLLAWFKLRRRSLGPILDGNGWAVNTQAKISIPFGGELTELAKLPKGAHRSLRDPYEQERPLWPYVLLATILIGGAVAHYFDWLHVFNL